MTKDETVSALASTELGRSQAQLQLLEKISQQQIQICAQLAELLQILTAPHETSLIDQLSELLQQLLQPISRRLDNIEAKLPPSIAAKP